MMSGAAARDIVAGGCAGMAATSIMYPMDTVRTRLQMFGNQGKFPGVRACVADTIRNEGVRAFYKGMAFPFTAQALFKIVIFTTNGVASRALGRRGLADRPAGIFACGALSGGVNSFILTPVELIRTRLMLQFERDTRRSRASMKGPVDGVRQIVRRHGLLGMWQGLKITFARDALGMGLFFLAFDTAKRFLTRLRYGGAAKSLPDSMENRPPDFDILLLSGCGAGITFWTVALPFDMAKTVIQGTVVKKGQTAPEGLAIMAHAFRDGGFRRLYLGWPVAFGRGIPGAALLLATHSYVSRELEGRALVATRAESARRVDFVPGPEGVGSSRRRLTASPKG